MHPPCSLPYGESGAGTWEDLRCRLEVRYDLTFEEFFWTEAGAKSQFAFGLIFPPRVGSRVTGNQLTVFQNLGHEYLNAHKMCEYGHLERTDTVE